MKTLYRSAQLHYPFGLVDPHKEPAPGDIVITSDAGFFTKAIEYATGSRYSHCEIFMGNIWGHNLMCGAGPTALGLFGKVRVVSLDNRPEYEIYRVSEDPKVREAICRFALSKMDKPYAYGQLVIDAYRILTKTVDKSSTDYWPDSYVCSELVAYALHYAGVSFGHVPNGAMPHQIVEADVSTLIGIRPRDLDDKEESIREDAVSLVRGEEFTDQAHEAPEDDQRVP